MFPAERFQNLGEKYQCLQPLEEIGGLPFDEMSIPRLLMMASGICKDLVFLNDEQRNAILLRYNEINEMNLDNSFAYISSMMKSIGGLEDLLISPNKNPTLSCERNYRDLLLELAEKSKQSIPPKARNKVREQHKRSPKETKEEFTMMFQDFTNSEINRENPLLAICYRKKGNTSIVNKLFNRYGRAYCDVGNESCTFVNGNGEWEEISAREILLNYLRNDLLTGGEHLYATITKKTPSYLFSNLKLAGKFREAILGMLIADSFGVKLLFRTEEDVDRIARRPIEKDRYRSHEHLILPYRGESNKAHEKDGSVVIVIGDKINRTESFPSLLGTEFKFASLETEIGNNFESGKRAHIFYHRRMLQANARYLMKTIEKKDYSLLQVYENFCKLFHLDKEEMLFQLGEVLPSKIEKKKFYNLIRTN